MGRSRGATAHWSPGDVPEVLDALERVYGEPRFVSRFEPVDELVSCILSQHSADANSFPAFTRLKEAFPTWEDVVEAGPERVAVVVKKAGLANQKSKSIVRSLIEIKKRNGSYTLENLRGMRMGDAKEWLLSLPGVGPKTASIVLCFSFGMPAVPVDTHVLRVSKRLGLLPEGCDERRAHDLMLEIVPERDAFRYHVLVIQHGRNLCRARKPDCAECPVSKKCRYYLGGSSD